MQRLSHLSKRLFYIDNLFLYKMGSMAKANGVRTHYYMSGSRTCDDRTCDEML